MKWNGTIWVGNEDDGTHAVLLPKMANRHGLIAGATGTGKTTTLKVLAESFSDMGVPVFLADVKGDLAGMCQPGENNGNMQARMERFGLAENGFDFHSYPVDFWDIYGKKGIQLRTTITEMGPLLLARILGLNDLQSDLLSVAFRIADANNLLLIDTKDLKALLNYMDENRQEFQKDYGKISSASIAVMIRAIVALEGEGGDIFFGEPALNIGDWFTTDANGKGMIHILDSESLINNGKLYSTFLLWLISELFEQLPEVGDLEKPKMVFFFDEAHLLFDGASKELLDKIEQVVKLIRSKGVGIYFITQNPSDIPDGVLAQLGNKIEHGLHAYTPKEQKAVKAAAESFRVNPAFDTFDTILNLGTGEAVCSFLDENGVPGVAEKVSILPPQSKMGAIDDAVRTSVMNSSILSAKYAVAVDPDSAYEFLQRKVSQEAADAQKAAEEAEKARQQEEADKEAAKQKAAEEKEAAKQKAAEEKEAAKQKAAEEKAAEREKAAAEKAAAKEAEKAEKEKSKKSVKKAAKSVSSSVAGTVGREVGKQVGGSLFGKFGKTLGGNLGASLGRGIIGTLFKQ